ncbi:MAG: ADP-ribose pyrophosphatase, partial [Lentimonas sp.]
MPEQDEAGAPKAWELLDDQLLNTCRVWDLRARRYRHPKQGGDSEFYYIDSRDWVIVIARTLTGELILIRQFRCGSNALSWELPGGIIDAGEDPVAAGLRELREETGYNAKRGDYIGSCRPNPAILNNHCHFVFADKVELNEAGTDWDE